ncbi:major centromere autoantigen B-like [Enoplosus armatus]|uniref:major centromere autoantigen B-like n=1 Tax=Enoplosus armatus TaxID=215367 RepID=UPI003992C4DB
MAPRRRFDFKFKERVLEYAEKHSGEKTARHFNIDTKRIRYWRKQKCELLLADKGRARLTGGGRKKVSLELEERLSEWIYSMRDKHNRVSRNMIKNKALEIYPSVSDGGKVFVASTGWLQRFLERNDLSLRRRTPMIQTDPSLLTEKLVSFVDYVGKAVGSNGILERDIIAMDEATVWFDVVPPTTTDTGGALKSTGHGKSHLTVVLAAKADGTKLKPFIVFRGAAGEVAAMQQQVSGAVISSSVNGWMNDALTADWLQSVAGQFNLTPRLLVWDSYRCHIGAATKAELKCGYNITTAEIPGGCTKYVQAPDVMWNQPFRQSLHDAYDQWAAGDADKEYTAGGNLKAPGRRLLVDWVVAAWDKLDQDMIRESFKVCGLSVKSDGSEDDLILCFREGQPCAAGREALTRVRQQSRENRCQAAQEEEDEEELFNNELVVLDDDEEEKNSDNASVEAAMSVIIQTRGEVGGGVAAHLQCPLCGHFSKSHAHQLSHMAASHPACLDGVAVGRLGNILMYQSTARLFHCSDCFYTSRDFTKLYKHIISKHCMDEREGGGGDDGREGGGGDDGSEKGEEKMGEEGEEEDKEGGKDALKSKRGSEAEEEEEGEGHNEDGASQRLEAVKADSEGDESVLMFDGAGYRCLICGWKNKLKGLGINHVVRKHDIPKAYAAQAVRRDAAAPKQTQSSGAEEEEVAGLSGELLKEEMEATAKVVRFISNRFVCLICGWKTKLKGFAISHVVRSHDVERPYRCKDCSRSFFLPSRLQQHVRAAHRPGRYACPFCCFRSHFLGGFRRHCSRCNAREEEEGGGGGGGGRGGVGVGAGGGGGEEEDIEEEEENEERKEMRGGRKRRRAGRVILEDDDEDD